MDGDMILEPNSLKKFLDKGITEKLLIAVTQRISKDPVYANVQTEHPLIIKEFSFTQKSNYEWANIVSMEASWLQSGTSHVFEYLRKFLPASAAVIDRMEIDTPEDLRYAEQRLASGDPWI